MEFSSVSSFWTFLDWTSGRLFLQGLSKSIEAFNDVSLTRSAFNDLSWSMTLLDDFSLQCGPEFSPAHSTSSEASDSICNRKIYQMEIHFKNAHSRKKKSAKKTIKKFVEPHQRGNFTQIRPIKLHLNQSHLIGKKHYQLNKCCKNSTKLFFPK